MDHGGDPRVGRAQERNAANPGISAVVQPNGTIEEETGLFVSSYRVAHLAWPDTQSFYVLYGDVLAVTSAALSSVLLLSCLLLRSRGRKK